MSLQHEYDLFAPEDCHFFAGEGCGFHNEIEMLADGEGAQMDYRFSEANFQIDEIMENFVLDCPLKPSAPTEAQKPDMRASCSRKIQKTPEKAFGKRQKKIKKNENSPFHNYQKHLNNALKKLIIVPEFGSEEGAERAAAVEIWQAYCRCEIKTKRVLHFIFNERNEHTINDSELHTYGLFPTYQRFPPEVLAQARAYLSKLAIDQLDRHNVDAYLKSRKLKTKDGFGEYILAFKNELETGYLKRRINLDKL